MKYCKTTTENHPVSVNNQNCLDDFNTLLLNEGYSEITNLFSSEETVLNLDCIEASIALDEERERKRSMDFCFGIANENCSIQLMVLAELKLNNEKPHNIKKEHLVEKVNGSLSALKKSLDIYANYIFIFKSDRKEEAKSRFFRMNPRIPNEYLVMDLPELRSTFF